jgi:hypothetical protein
MLYAMLCCNYPYERPSDEGHPQCQLRIVQRIVHGAYFLFRPPQPHTLPCMHTYDLCLPIHVQPAIDAFMLAAHGCQEPAMSPVTRLAAAQVQPATKDLSSGGRMAGNALPGNDVGSRLSMTCAAKRMSLKGSLSRPVLLQRTTPSRRRSTCRPSARTLWRASLPWTLPRASPSPRSRSAAGHTLTEVHGHACPQALQSPACVEAACL